MTTDEALAIAAERAWVLVPVAIWPRGLYDVWNRGGDPPVRLERWWVVMDVDEVSVFREEDGRITDYENSVPPTFGWIEDVPEGESLAPTVVEAVEKMLAKEIADAKEETR